MATLISSWTWCDEPKYNAWVNYDYWRDGQNMKYKYYVYTYMASSGGWYNDWVRCQIYFNQTSTVSQQGNIKKSTSGSIGHREDHWTSKEFSVAKISGSVPFKVDICNGGGSGWRYQVESSKIANCVVTSAVSSMGTTTEGSTLSGPTINVTKYDSSFVDNITLSYNNKTITRDNFTSSQLTFSEEERLLIFQAQGVGTTVSWDISGETYSGSTLLGSFSGSVNISTEALSTVSAAANFNVESSTTYSTTNACGGTSKVVAYVGGYGETYVYDSGSFSGVKSSQSCTPASASIYASNTSSKTGTIYWRIYSYVNDTEIGHVDSRTCTYTFVQSLCGPSLSSFQYKISDAGTKALMGSTGSYYNYNNNTDLGKFINGKTTITLKIAGSANTSKKATVDKFYVTIPGQGDTDFPSGNELTSQVITSNGTVYGYIKDSRGFYTSLSFSYSLNDYYLPSFTSMTVARNTMSSTDPNIDKYVKLTATISLPSYMATYVKNNSTCTVMYQYKVSGTTSWSNGNDIKSQFTASGNSLYCTAYQLSTQFDSSNQYDFRLVIKEYYTTSSGTTSGIVIIPISAPLLSKRSKMLGINKIPTSYTLDVGGSINADTYIKSGSNMVVGTYIEFPTAFSSSTNSCTMRFKRSDGYYDILKIVNGEIFFYNSNSGTSYELLAFEQVDSW